MQRSSGTAPGQRGASIGRQPNNLPPAQQRKINIQGSSPNLYAKVGSGTLQDPYVYWTTNPTNLTRERFEACNEIAKQQAREQSALAAVVRKENHDTGRRRDPLTGIPTGTQEVADNHITLYFGRDIKDMQKEDEAYTNVDSKGNPISIMKPEDCKIVRAGHERVSTEYWPIRKQPLANIRTNIVETGPKMTTSTLSNGNYLRTSTVKRANLIGQKTVEEGRACPDDFYY